MLLVALRKGGAKCSSACPYYEESGCVRGLRGVPLKTHCRATMEPVMIDCDIFNPLQIEKLEVSEEQWKAMQRAVHKRAKKERKPYPEDHDEIHPVGWNWKDPAPFLYGTKGKWNSEKSSNVR